MSKWRWRGTVALLGVSVAFFILPLLPVYDVIDSDWPAFATGARLIVTDPAHLYDLDVQKKVQLEVTGGRVLVTTGIQGILPFLAPAWVALVAVPFDALGTDVGGRLWVLFGLACLVLGLLLANRPRAPSQVLPAFAGVPTALLLLNAQLDGIVALGIGAAFALWSRPYLGGLALGLTLMKPQLVLPLGVALLAARLWKVLAGWATGGVILLAPTLALNPNWISQWRGQIQSTVAPVSREVDLAHFGTLLPAEIQTYAVLVLAAIALIFVLALSTRRRDNFRAVMAVLVIGGILVSPHALPADLVLVAFGLGIWGEATWGEWLTLSAGALLAALTPAPVPAVIGVLVIGWLCLRISRARQPAPGPVSPR